MLRGGGGVQPKTEYRGVVPIKVCCIVRLCFYSELGHYKLVFRNYLGQNTKPNRKMCCTVRCIATFFLSQLPFCRSSFVQENIVNKMGHKPIKVEIV